tara:strand:- start:102 stop:335 length:234 start_codon:yes stop_codon:yes gene_type:complete
MPAWESMFVNIQRGVYEGNIFWFAGLDAQEPGLLHITIRDETNEHIHYYSEEVQGQSVDLKPYFEKFKEKVNEKSKL